MVARASCITWLLLQNPGSVPQRADKLGIELYHTFFSFCVYKIIKLILASQGNNAMRTLPNIYYTATHTICEELYKANGALHCRVLATVCRTLHSMRGNKRTHRWPCCVHHAIDEFGVQVFTKNDFTWSCGGQGWGVASAAVLQKDDNVCC